ncbi:MAG: zinc ribbon domain-containing protein [Bacteroidetes bacterium]|nr:zinc ribbon domain-containing protein [Bacteroidota bacterium]
MEECPSCALEVARKLKVCPYCGYEFPKQSNSRTLMAWVMAILLAWPLFEIIKLIF